MLVLASTEFGKMWHKWAKQTLALYGESWVRNVPNTLLQQKPPENRKELQALLHTKIRLFELADNQPLALSEKVNGNMMIAIFGEIHEKYWYQLSSQNLHLKLDFGVFMTCLEEGLITVCEQKLTENVAPEH